MVLAREVRRDTAAAAAAERRRHGDSFCVNGAAIRMHMSPCRPRVGRTIRLIGPRPTGALSAPTGSRPEAAIGRAERPSFGQRALLDGFRRRPSMLASSPRSLKPPPTMAAAARRCAPYRHARATEPSRCSRPRPSCARARLRPSCPRTRRRPPPLARRRCSPLEPPPELAPPRPRRRPAPRAATVGRRAELLRSRRLAPVHRRGLVAAADQVDGRRVRARGPLDGRAPRVLFKRGPTARSAERAQGARPRPARVILCIGESCDGTALDAAELSCASSFCAPRRHVLQEGQARARRHRGRARRRARHAADVRARPREGAPHPRKWFSARARPLVATRDPRTDAELTAVPPTTSCGSDIDAASRARQAQARASSRASSTSRRRAASRRRRVPGRCGRRTARASAPRSGGDSAILAARGAVRRLHPRRAAERVRLPTENTTHTPRPARLAASSAGRASTARAVPSHPLLRLLLHPSVADSPCCRICTGHYPRLWRCPAPAPQTRQAQ